MRTPGARSVGGNAERQLAILILGVCPAAVVSTRVIDALFMSAGLVFVLAAMSMLLPVIRRLASEEPTPSHALPRQAAGPGILWGALLLSSCFTAAFELALYALAPAEASRLGIYVPLLAVSLLVAGRLEALAEIRSARAAAVDALRNGAACAGILVATALVREILGAGTITLGSTVALGPLLDDPARALGLAGGALLCLGYAAGAVRLMRRGDAGGEEGTR